LPHPGTPYRPITTGFLIEAEDWVIGLGLVEDAILIFLVSTEYV